MLLEVAFLLVLLTSGTYQQCPAGYGEHPVVVVSMDGFRFDYLQRGLTPNIQSVKDRGVSAPFMKASYPTITFPNHYTIATGLYPESHGIIANKFYDQSFGAQFSLGSDESLKGRWWGGEPIWNTVVKQGKLSATYFWPGSDADIEGMHPSYYYRYDDAVSFESRVDQVLLWLSLPETSRPTYICMYFDEPDHTGHSFGPYSSEVNDAIAEVDSMIGRLVDGIASLNLTDCVNLILLADHGMTNSTQETIIQLTDYAPNVADMVYYYPGAFVRLDVDDEYLDQTDDIRSNLTCQREEMRQYTIKTLPTRFHFSNNLRIEEIIMDLNLGYTGEFDSTYYLLGEHGYDNYYEDMQPVFMAAGPEFLVGVEVAPFQNIQLYNLLCTLTGVVPAPNNGTEASLYHLLKSPPAYPTLNAETPPASPAYPSVDEIDAQSHLSGCLGDDLSPLTLNFTSSEEAGFLGAQVPWGLPLSGQLPANFILLYQEDHVTGFSQTLKTPLWTSFVIDADAQGPASTDWSSDVRLTSQNTPTCADYATVASLNITMQTLFPNRYGKSTGDVNFIVSNAVPMKTDIIARWNYLIDTLLPQWFNQRPGSLNVIAGPIYDNDSNSLVDDLLTYNSSPAVPSHFYLIATRCEAVPGVAALSDCPTDGLDSLSFIYPQTIDISNCLSDDNFALEYSSRVQDIEIATGLTFFPNLPYKDRTDLATRIQSNLWS